MGACIKNFVGLLLSELYNRGHITKANRHRSACMGQIATTQTSNLKQFTNYRHNTHYCDIAEHLSYSKIFPLSLSTTFYSLHYINEQHTHWYMRHMLSGIYVYTCNIKYGSISQMSNIYTVNCIDRRIILR